MGSIYYHGTNSKNAKKILKEGFKVGTYFTWDLHSALVMGGNHIFGVYFHNKDIKDYWEWISNKIIISDKILYYRRFSVKSIYENEEEQEKLRRHFHIENNGKAIIHCKKCKGRGQLNKPYIYKHLKPKNYEIEVCNICKGFGCLKRNGKPLNEK